MTDPLLGTDVGRYRIERLLGEGGMGAVYLGVQPMIGSRVAIKVLSQECARSPELLERFFAEARSVNLIRHENIVSVLDLAQLPDGRPYIVMEFIEGQTLGQIIRATIAQGQRVPIGGIVQVATEMLSALGAAHALGIIHRDLKPDNVLVTAEGHAKVLDFGIAKLAPGLNQHSPRTRTGALLGTPAYMAPEQISGTGSVDARTDIYAAGVVLFEAITGTQPFAGDTLFDLMRAHMEHAPPSPRERRPEMPLGFEHVILTALAKDPAHRFQSAGAMAQALRQAANELHGEQWRSLSGRSLTGGRISLEQLRVPTPNSDPARSPTHLATPIPSPHRDAAKTERTPPSRKGLYGAIAAIAIVGSIVGAIVLATGKRTADRVAGVSGENAGSGTAGDLGGMGPGGTIDPTGTTGSTTGTTNPTGSTTGTTGPTGTTTNPTNPTGTTNATGSTTGTTGSAAGSTNPTGSTGSTSNPTGSTNPTGPTTNSTGTTGATGATGSTNPTGTTGSTPPAGSRGSTGSTTNSTGSTGSTGATTAQGSTGSTNTNGPTIVGGGSAADHGVHVGPGVTIGSGVTIGGNAPPPSIPGRVKKPFDQGNPKKFDAMAYAPKALALARTVYPDAGFTRMDTYSVFPTGLTDLTIGDDDTTYWFRSPAHSARPAGIPKNQEVDIYCYVEVSVSAKEIEVWAREINIDANCKAPIRPLPRCTLAGVWAQAKAQGAEADTIAKIGFLTDGKWFFDNDGDDYEGLTESFADKCP